MFEIGDKVWLVGYGYEKGKFIFGVVSDTIVDRKWSFYYLKNQNKAYIISNLFRTREDCRNFVRSKKSNTKFNIGDTVWFFKHKDRYDLKPTRNNLYIDEGTFVSNHSGWIRLYNIGYSLTINDVFTTRKDCEEAMEKAIRDGKFAIKPKNHLTYTK